MPGPPRLDPVAADGAQPPYVLAQQSLAHAIATGSLAPGQRLPSERYLCEQLGISRGTLRRTLTGLRQQGLVESSPRRGWEVTQVGFTHSADSAALISFTDVNRRLGRTVASRVLRARTRRATSAEAESLGLDTGAPLFELRRVRFLDGLPICLSHDLIPASLAPGIDRQDFTTASLLGFLAGSGHAPTRARYTARAAFADDEEAAHLDLTAPAPVLRTTRLSYDAAGTACADNRETYRADRHELRLTLGH
ncbi:GntR family transcriptional regulator [Streptomyces sp. NPDC047123]|uniref:GntR family transcriptional regulator n=1 Tax=unclassified Streptomyces TaxID=2593676 RepID=UPI0033D24780